MFCSGPLSIKDANTQLLVWRRCWLSVHWRVEILNLLKRISGWFVAKGQTCWRYKRIRKARVVAMEQKKRGNSRRYDVFLLGYCTTVEYQISYQAEHATILQAPPKDSTNKKKLDKKFLLHKQILSVKLWYTRNPPSCEVRFLLSLLSLNANFHTGKLYHFHLRFFSSL